MANNVDADCVCIEVDIAEGSVGANTNFPAIAEVSQRLKSIAALGNFLNTFDDSNGDRFVQFLQVAQGALLKLRSEIHVLSSWRTLSAERKLSLLRAARIRFLTESVSSRPASGSTSSITSERSPRTSSRSSFTSFSNTVIFFPLLPMAVNGSTSEPFAKPWNPVECFAKELFEYWEKKVSIFFERSRLLISERDAR